MTILFKIATTPDQVVFSGDKRLSDAHGVSDHHVKATILGRNGVGGATGRTRTIHPETGAVQRDVHEQVRAFFHERDGTNASIEEFKQQLRAAYQQYLNDYRGGVEQDGVDCDLFWIAMTYFSEGVQLDCPIRAHVTTADGLVAHHTLHRPRESTLLVSGDPVVKKALLQRHEAFAEVYAHDDIAALLVPPVGVEFGRISVDRAIEICRFVNRVCAERAEQITGEQSTISRECDVLLLDRSGVRPV